MHFQTNARDNKWRKYAKFSIFQCKHRSFWMKGNQRIKKSVWFGFSEILRLKQPEDRNRLFSKQWKRLFIQMNLDRSTIPFWYHIESSSSWNEHLCLDRPFLLKRYILSPPSAHPLNAFTSPIKFYIDSIVPIPCYNKKFCSWLMNIIRSLSMGMVYNSHEQRWKKISKRDIHCVFSYSNRIIIVCRFKSNERKRVH